MRMARHGDDLRLSDHTANARQGTPSVTVTVNNTRVSDVITVFQKPIEAMTDSDPARIKEEVRNTIWHEFAHHFGLDEIDIEVREQKRR